MSGCSRGSTLAVALLAGACSAGAASPSPTPTTAPPTAPPTPSPSPSEIPSPSAAAMPLPTSDGVALSAGTYYVVDPGNTGYTNAARLSFTVPAGWTSADFAAKNRGKPGEVFFAVWVVSYVFTDACHWG